MATNGEVLYYDNSSPLSVNYAVPDTLLTTLGKDNGIATLDSTGNVPADQLANISSVAAFTTLQSDVSTLQTDESTNASNISTLQSDVSTLQTDESTNASNITTLQSDVSTLQSDVSTLQTDETTNAGNISTLQSDVSSLQSTSTSHTASITQLNTNFQPWLESGWSTILSNVVSTGTAVPIYQGAISGGSNDTYFINTNTAADQPAVITLAFQNTYTIALLVYNGNPSMSPIMGSYVIPPGTQSLTLPLPAMVSRPIAAGTYTDLNGGADSITFSAVTDCLCFYIGVGFPWGPLSLPPTTPFTFSYVLSTAVGTYLSSSTAVTIEGYIYVPPA